MFFYLFTIYLFDISESDTEPSTEHDTHALAPVVTNVSNQALESLDDDNSNNQNMCVLPKPEAEPVFEFGSAHSVADILARRISESRCREDHDFRDETHAADVNNDGSSDECILLNESVPSPLKTV